MVDSWQYNVGDAIDRLITVEFREKGSSQGVLVPLYEAARKKQGAPLTLAAATGLRNALSDGGTVLILTGAGLPPYLPKGETDGPPGAAALARVLRDAFNAVPVLVSESEFLGPFKASATAVGLNLQEDYAVARKIPHGATAFALSLDRDPTEQAEELLEKYDPAAVIAVEKLGPNRAGVIHSSTGMDLCQPYNANLAPLFELARERGIFTVGVGDNGNELGFGNIEEAVRKHKPYGDVCQCECKQGLACVVKTDALVIANTSNWGAYGIAAAVALLLDRPGLMYESQLELRSVEACLLAGAADGANGRFIPTVDDTPYEFQAYIFDMLRHMVRNGGDERSRDF